MSLKSLLGLGKKLFGKKESAVPTTGKQQKLLTYEGKGSQATGQELVETELRNPPVRLKKTKELHMGDDIAPAFGSSTYDWIMRKGPGRYSADEWVDHLTSTRNETFKIFGKPATRKVRDIKKFKYDRGPFAGKEVNINKEELFDSNLAIFNEAGDLSGGLLFAAKKFGLKLDGNQLGAMIKLNPINRLKPIELGVSEASNEAFSTAIKTARGKFKTIRDYYANSAIRGSDEIVEGIDELFYKTRDLGPGTTNVKNVVAALSDDIKMVRNNPRMRPEDRKILNEALGDIQKSYAPMQNNRVFYKGENSYTLQGGKNYKETIFTLDDAIGTNMNPYNRGGHFSEVLPKETNNIYHVRFDTRFTPDGKKVFMINEIQSDVNQSIAKQLSKAQQLGGEKRINPFQADLEMKLLLTERGTLLKKLDDAIKTQDSSRVDNISRTLSDINKKLKNMTVREQRYDYFPMVEADAYGDHALKYLVQKAAREGVDYVAVAPFNKLSFRQGYKAGNERFYGYPDGKGIGKKGKAVMPDLMRKLANFYNTSAGQTKLTLSDPKLPYKLIEKETFKYPDKVKLKDIVSQFHADAVKDPKKGYRLILENDPRLYFDAFAIKVTPAMRLTQKTYKSKGGLVVDIFKPLRYNRPWL